ncbi:MAG: polysaccharide biosynthesis C-terminal domain-containing protein, partial [Lachnospiraceae bacterium]|nr:polysaccharide biosynthesis C-terminal domain-containing protein [Lachnospiraceae bacterium]
AITASIGNLLVENDVQHVNKVFYRVFFLGSFIYGISTIGMMCGFQAFIVWYAGNDYLLNYTTVVLICISYYITGIRKTVLTFRDASATYYYDRYKSVAEAGANLILSIFFAKHLGINGVILGTIISAVFISLWVEPFVLYKYVLKTGLSKYFRKMLAYSVCTCLAGFLSMNFCKDYSFESLFLKMAVNILTGALVFVVVYIVCFWKTDEMQYVKNLGLKFLQNNKK